MVFTQGPLFIHILFCAANIITSIMVSLTPLRIIEALKLTIRELKITDSKGSLREV